MSMIRTFNSTISDAVNKDSEFYKAFIGQVPYTPEITILESDDVNCGAICNELEFARLVSNYYVECLSLEGAEDTELEEFIEGFIDMSRRGQVESDSNYRLRFRFIVTEKMNLRRTTKWAILDSMTYFVSATQVQLLEFFDLQNLYFQIRFEGVVNYEDALFINNIDQGYIGQNYVGGAGIGEVVTYIAELIRRIKAAGVDFDVYFVEQNRFTKTSDCTIGTVQMYKTSNTTILTHVQMTKTSDAKIVV